MLNLFHYRNGIEGKRKWEERLKRVNDKSPFLIKKTIVNDDDAYRFSELPYKNKIGFYYKELNLENIICLNGWNDSEIRYKYNWDFRRYVRESVSDQTGIMPFPILNVFSKHRLIKCRMK